MRASRFFVSVLVFIAALAVIPAAGQDQTADLKEPYGPANPLVSPDGTHALFGSSGRPQLWLEDRRTHERRMVFRVTIQTMTLAWSPDSTAFIANDRPTSDLEIAYIYDVNTLGRLDLRSRIVAADPGSMRFFVPGQIDGAPAFAPNTKIPTHSYVHALRWLDAQHVEVQLRGDTAGACVQKSVRPGGCYDVQPGDCFDLRYRVSRAGQVQKLSQRVALVGSKACDAID
jgi:hypothetical protein